MKRRRAGKGHYKRRKAKNSHRWIVYAFIVITAVLLIIYSKNIYKEKEKRQQEKLLLRYMKLIPEQEYGQMYEMLCQELSGNISEEDFIKRNAAIYEGIEVRNLSIMILEYDEKQKQILYETSMDTAAGKICFENEASFQKTKKGYRLIWEDSMIFPNLTSADKVRVEITEAERGRILDRNGRVLAGKGIAFSVGIVPGKIKNREETISQLTEMLEISREEIEEKLSARWVTNDTFVPVKTMPGFKEIELMKRKPDEKVLLEEEERKKLLEIPGVMISEVEVRKYPLGEAAAHLIGYVQSVTAEDLEEHPGEGYTENSVIGRTGMEGLFEKELKGQDGCRIYLVNSQGREKEVLASVSVQHGQDVQLTIDSSLQAELYERFKDDKGCSVAMNPYTGEVLALVSTPSYDNNDFILGLSEAKWKRLNEDKKQPMYNRFRQNWCPGSTFKPVIAAIGLESGAVHPMEDYGREGLSWQKDTTWGDYYVTTLQEYEPVILENALIYSDNIYFAKAALKIGYKELEVSLNALCFDAELPFEIRMTPSQYSNTEHIETEIQLADSGYGQGQILINPLHLACIYSAFCNDGNVRKPHLLYQMEGISEYWISGIFSKESADFVLEGMKKVVNDCNGTGYAAHREDVLLAGKTGTAEIKGSTEDTSGTELGWFAVSTTEDMGERSIVLISMVEDVKGIGGSGYVVQKTSMVLDKWFQNP